MNDTGSRLHAGHGPDERIQEEPRGGTGRLSRHRLQLIRSQLETNARLFDDPGAYRSGVEDALAAVERALGFEGRRIDLSGQEPRARMI